MSTCTLSACADTLAMDALFLRVFFLGSLDEARGFFSKERGVLALDLDFLLPFLDTDRSGGELRHCKSALSSSRTEAEEGWSSGMLKGIEENKLKDKRSASGEFSTQCRTYIQRVFHTPPVG
jgi:hypothetical protein